MLRRTRGTYSSTALDPEEYFGENYDVPTYEEYLEDAQKYIPLAYKDIEEVDEDDISEMIDLYMDKYANDSYHDLDSWEWDDEFRAEFYEEATGRKLNINKENNNENN